jgi:type III restriction enzyme
MSNPFFDHPILNSPYEYPRRHWELDEAGQPTQKIMDARRGAKFIAPIPKPKKRKAPTQAGFVFDEGKGLSTKKQQYDPTSIINEVRSYVDAWRQLSTGQWQVTSETARFLQHWRHHEFSGVRPFFCQAEVAEKRARSSLQNYVNAPSHGRSILAAWSGRRPDAGPRAEQSCAATISVGSLSCR